MVKASELGFGLGYREDVAGKILIVKLRHVAHGHIREGEPAQAEFKQFIHHPDITKYLRERLRLITP